MSGPRPLLLLLACLCAAAPRAAAQPEDEGLALSRRTAAMRGLAGAPRLLVIGDSHTVGPFGHELDARLRADYPGWKIETYASCGASPGWYLPGNAASGHTSACGTWFRRYSAADPSKLEDATAAAPTPLIGALLASNPDTVIVALGTNMANWEKGGISGMEPARALADAIVAAGARCLWIGPPDELGHMSHPEKQVKKINEQLPAALGESCLYLQSRTKYSPDWPDPMKLHYPPVPGRAWGVQAALGVQRVLGVPEIPAAGH